MKTIITILFFCLCMAAQGQLVEFDIIRSPPLRLPPPPPPPPCLYQIMREQAEWERQRQQQQQQERMRQQQEARARHQQLLRALSSPQGIVSFTTRCLYDFHSERTSRNVVSFAINNSSNTLSITGEGFWAGRNREHSIINSQQVFDNDLGEMYHFLVEAQSTQFILIIAEGFISFARNNDSPIQYILLFDCN